MITKETSALHILSWQTSASACKRSSVRVRFLRVHAALEHALTTLRVEGRQGRKGSSASPYHYYYYFYCYWLYPIGWAPEVMLNTLALDSPDVKGNTPGKAIYDAHLGDSLLGSSVNIGTIQRRLTWPLRKDATHTSKSVSIILAARGYDVHLGSRVHPAYIIILVSLVAPRVSAPPHSGNVNRESGRIWD